MLARHRQLLERYERVKEFLRAHVPAGAPPAYVAKMNLLTAFLARLTALLSDQVTGVNESRDDLKRTARARRTLRERHLRPIALIAKGELSSDPDALESLAIPTARLTNTDLLTAAGSVRKAAQKYEQLFVDAGRPADFLAQLDAAMGALNASLLNRASNVGLHVGARAGLAQALRDGRRQLHVLDALVTDAYAGNAEVLARWQLAKRVKGLPNAPRATGGTADENLAPAA